MIKPKSKGTITIDSCEGPPLIKLVVNDEDIESLTKEFKQIFKMTDSLSLEDLNAKFLDVKVPNCRNYNLYTENYAKCNIENLGVPTGLVVGTTKLGHRLNQSSVVDENLLVHNLRCLRIVDSGIFPEIPPGNPMGTTAMVALKISEKIKKKWMNHNR